MIPIVELMSIAEGHAHEGDMASSAVMCLANAARHQNEGRMCTAASWAIRSLDYSIGVHHPDRKRARRLQDQVREGIVAGITVGARAFNDGYGVGTVEPFDGSPEFFVSVRFDRNPGVQRQMHVDTIRVYEDPADPFVGLA